MLRNIKAVIFDLDGTLVDSMWMWKQIDIEYLASIGYELPGDLQSCINGMSFYETAIYFKNRFGVADSVDKIMNDWNNMALMKYTNEVPLKNGVKEFLEHLSENKIKLGIATSNSFVLASAALKSNGIFDYFDSIISGDEKMAGKPEPDIYIESSRKLSIPVENCLVFEDITAGIMAGKSAGMKVCTIKDAYSEYEIDQKKALADYYINDYTEIINNTYEVLN